MQTLTRSGVSVFIFEDDDVVTLTESLLTSDHFTAAGTQIPNTVLYQDITIPEDWAGNKYLFDGSSWTLNSDWMDIEEQEISNLYIHLTMTDGDGREPLGIKNDGVDTLGITATFRQSADPESPVITSITGMAWRVTIRDEAGRIYDIVDVTFNNGIASFSYTTDGKPDICSIVESDFEQIEMGGAAYQLKLIGASTFKVYRQL